MILVPQYAEPRPIRRVLVIAGFIAWCALATVAGAVLTAWHAIALTPQTALGSGNAGSGWHVRHYLSADCAHSRALARYLEGRRPLAQADEEVILVGPNHGFRPGDLQAGLAQAGFQVQRMRAEAAATKGIQVVPTLEVIAPGGAIRFRGGYQDSSLLPAKYLDTVIVEGLIASRPIPKPRIYGCAISPSVRAQLNPFDFLKF